MEREIQYWRSIDRGNGFDIGNVRSRLANLSYMTIVKLNLVEIEQQLRSGSGMKISSSCWSIRECITIDVLTYNQNLNSNG